MLSSFLAPLLVLLLLAATTPALAHVKLYYSPFRLPIRNAPGPTSDGLFSAATNQPCGGQNQWGRGNQRRYATNIVDGQTVCTRVNWNGGHITTKNENKLKAVFTCQQPDNPQRFLALDPLVLNNNTYPPPDELFGSYVSAPLTNQEFDGYTVCVDLPFQNIAPDLATTNLARRCSLSVMEGNGWGGCVDMILQSKYHANGTLTPEVDFLAMQRTAVTEQVPYGRDVMTLLPKSEGTYRIGNCLTDTGGKCCLMGFLGVLPNGAVSARLRGSGPRGVCFDLRASQGYRDYQTILLPSKFDSTLFTGNIYLDMGRDEYDRPVTRQNMSITMRDGGALAINNVGFDIPEVSDHDAVYFSSLDNGVHLAYIPHPNYSYHPDFVPWALIVLGVLLGAVLVWLVGGLYVNWREGGPRCQHPHIHHVLVNLGLVRKTTSSRRRGGGAEGDDERHQLKLPENWFSAVDQTSEEVYYYNIVTKETKWDRPFTGGAAAGGGPAAA